MNPEEQNVLIVDGDALFAELLAEQVAQLGFASVRHAADAAAALALAEENPGFFDLLLCGLDAPAAGGAELLRQLGRRGFDGGVVLMAEAGGQCLEAGLHGPRMLGTLQKPFSAAVLWQVLGQPADAPRRRKQGGACILAITAAELEKALSLGKLSLYYQPQVDVRSEAIVGVEALLRWNHPRLGLVSPVRFIAQAEHLGLIDRLAERVFKAALAQAGQWMDSGLALDLSVNVSMQNLQIVALPEVLAAMAGHFGLPLDCLTLDLNESQLASHPAWAREVLARLRGKGLGLAVDDFGAGLADLQHLAALPFTELKIGRPFIVNASHKPAALALLKKTVAAAKQLRWRVAAKGIENERQWALAKEIGCDLAQGYYLAKPMPAAALAACLRNWNDTTLTIKSAYDQALRARVV